MPVVKREAALVIQPHPPDFSPNRRGSTMIKEEDFAAAADGPPDIAFVRLERKFREILEQNLEASQSGGASNHFIIEYMNHTLATAEALGLDFLEFYAVPDDNSSDVY